ncbi:MAG: energy-coupled thiamine transporter ThiT [Lachnospiraceae bacterium]|jgi:thiamine transporter|nr:energy-coupled thiamine transporter ThiT [Lachnospiraceae bacterium]
MSMFLIYDAENAEYLLQPAGYGILAVLLLALLAAILVPGGRKTPAGEAGSRKTKEMVFCAAAIALAMVSSTYLKLGSLPFGGSITLFSMLFVTLIGYFYGARTGIMAGMAYGILQLITGPYIYAPLQVLLDYPLAFGALGLSGLFRDRRHGLVTGYSVGVAGRYICHVISGYVFFAEYAPEGMNPLVYTLQYNLTYILPEMAATIVVLCVPAMARAIGQVKRQALE